MFYMQLRHQQLKLANLKLDVLASTDWLTDTLNRRAFTNGASALLAEGPDHRGTLLVIDVDRFKSINDQFGHEAGDEALQLLAKTIVASVRTGDLVGRIGGEEFGVFLPGATTEQAALVAERIRQSVNDATFAPSGAPHHLSVSVGGAVFDRELPYAELFRLADQQLYAAKRDGRNRVAIAPIRPGPIALAAA
jgi:diguanylate cyclase (GGDEF)-like protein